MSKLRVACIVIAIVLLALSAYILVYDQANLNLLSTAIFAVGVVGCLALLVGAILENVRLVLVAFIINLVLIIYEVIDTLGAYFHLDFFRDQHPATMSDNDILFNFLFAFVLELIFIYVNYAYYNELHGSGVD